MVDEEELREAVRRDEVEEPEDDDDPQPPPLSKRRRRISFRGGEAPVVCMPASETEAAAAVESRTSLSSAVRFPATRTWPRTASIVMLLLAASSTE